MLRLLFLIALAVALTVCGATVKLGNKTFFEHVQAIWKTEEVQDMRRGVEEKAGPSLEKVERAGKKALDELRKDAPDAAP